MTDTERSEVQLKLTVMLKEIDDLAFKFGGTPVQKELELSYHYMNHAAMAVNRIPIGITPSTT